MNKKKVHNFPQLLYTSEQKTFTMSYSCDKNSLELIKYVETNSSFGLNSDENDEVLIFTTRENGDSCEEEYSEIDLREGKELIKTLQSKFDMFDFSIYTIDEWVDISAKKNKK